MQLVFDHNFKNGLAGRALKVCLSHHMRYEYTRKTDNRHPSFHPLCLFILLILTVIVVYHCSPNYALSSRQTEEGGRQESFQIGSVLMLYYAKKNKECSPETNKIDRMGDPHRL